MEVVQVVRTGKCVHLSALDARPANPDPTAETYPWCLNQISELKVHGP